MISAAFLVAFALTAPTPPTSPCPVVSRGNLAGGDIVLFAQGSDTEKFRFFMPIAGNPVKLDVNVNTVHISVDVLPGHAFSFEMTRSEQLGHVHVVVGSDQSNIFDHCIPTAGLYSGEVTGPI